MTTRKEEPVSYTVTSEPAPPTPGEIFTESLFWELAPYGFSCDDIGVGSIFSSQKDDKGKMLTADPESSMILLRGTPSDGAGDKERSVMWLVAKHQI